MGVPELKIQRAALLAQLDGVEKAIALATPDTREDPEEGVAIHWFLDTDGAARLRVDTAKRPDEMQSTTLRRIADVRDQVSAFATGAPWPMVNVKPDANEGMVGGAAAPAQVDAVPARAPRRARTGR